jgi:hypothetical protein
MTLVNAAFVWCKLCGSTRQQVTALAVMRPPISVLTCTLTVVLVATAAALLCSNPKPSATRRKQFLLRKQLAPIAGTFFAITENRAKRPGAAAPNCQKTTSEAFEGKAAEPGSANIELS